MNANIRSPKSKEMWLKEGRNHCMAKRYKQAIHACQKAIQLDSNYIEAYIETGLILFNMGEYENALSIYKQAIKLDPKNAKIYAYQGETLYWLGRHDSAIAAYKQAALLDPAYKTVCANRYKEASRIGEPYNEISSSHKQPILIQIPESSNKNIARKQSVLNQTQDVRKSQKFLEEGNKLCKMRLYKEACVIYEKAIRCNPINADIYKAKGDALYELSRFEEACTAYSNAIELNHDYKNIYNEKIGPLIENGKRFEKDGDYIKALESYEQAVLFNPEDEKARMLRNRVSDKLKDIEERKTSKELWCKPFRYEM